MLLVYYVVFSQSIDLTAIYEKQLKTDFGITRLITSVVMHILMQPEFEQSLNMMKYAINHPWKFRS